jgi:hypothetical protein
MKTQTKAASALAMRYFERKTSYSKILGSGLGMPTKLNAETWIACIENELSPENLHCDGEISHTAAMKKQRELLAALAHIENILKG